MRRCTEEMTTALAEAAKQKAINKVSIRGGRDAQGRQLQLRWWGDATQRTRSTESRLRQLNLTPDLQQLRRMCMGQQHASATSKSVRDLWQLLLLAQHGETSSVWKGS